MIYFSLQSLPIMQMITPTYSTGKYIETLFYTLQAETTEALKWFHGNEMMSNDNCHLIVANEENVSITLGQDQKLHALARISKYLSQDKLKIIMNTFIQSQFNCCPLTWMFHCRTINNKINRLHEGTQDLYTKTII